MSKRTLSLIILPTLLVCSCATQTKSLMLGGLSGAAIGAGAGALADTGGQSNRRGQNVGIGAAVGLGIGLLSSYLLDRDVNNRLSEATGEMDNRIQFGDVPPNPFSPSYGFEPKKKKRGGK